MWRLAQTVSIWGSRINIVLAPMGVNYSGLMWDWALYAKRSRDDKHKQTLGHKLISTLAHKLSWLLKAQNDCSKSSMIWSYLIDNK